MKANGEFKIEKGIPIPEQRPSGEKSTVLRKLKVGESVLIPGNNASARNLAAKIIGTGNYASRSEGNGARIWRIK